MAAGSVSVILIFFGVANLLLSGYIIKVLVDMCRRHQAGTFSKYMKVMFAVVFLFLITQLMHLLRLFGAEEYAAVQAAFSLSFLLLLLACLLHIQKTWIAHEHLVRARHKQKLVDVE